MTRSIRKRGKCSVRRPRSRKKRGKSSRRLHGGSRIKEAQRLARDRALSKLTPSKTSSEIYMDLSNRLRDFRLDKLQGGLFKIREIPSPCTLCDPGITIDLHTILNLTTDDELCKIPIKTLKDLSETDKESNNIIRPFLEKMKASLEESEQRIQENIFVNSEFRKREWLRRAPTGSPEKLVLNAQESWLDYIDSDVAEDILNKVSILVGDKIADLSSYFTIRKGIFRLPYYAMRLVNLKELRLECDINSFDEGVCKFSDISNLEVLNLNYNNLTVVPLSILDLRKLKKLNIRGNNLLSFPDIGSDKLLSLEELYLDGNDDLRVLPMSILDINLKVLQVDEYLERDEAVQGLIRKDVVVKTFHGEEIGRVKPYPSE